MEEYKSEGLTQADLRRFIMQLWPGITWQFKTLVAKYGKEEFSTSVNTTLVDKYGRLPKDNKPCLRVLLALKRVLYTKFTLFYCVVDS